MRQSSSGSRYDVQVVILTADLQTLWQLQATKNYAVFFDLVYRGWRAVGYEGLDPTGDLRKHLARGRQCWTEKDPRVCNGKLLASTVEWFIA
jgi:hypothetical protein